MKQRPNRPASRPRPKTGPRKPPKTAMRSRPGPSPAEEPEVRRQGAARRSSPPPRVEPALRPGRQPIHEAPHVAPLEVLARSALDVAMAVERVVLGEGKHADRAIAAEL